MLNWKVRIKNKIFWLSMIPAILLLIQLIVQIFGVTLDFGELGNNLKEIVNTIFFILSLCGIVVDPTTAGIGDSDQALTYDEPRENY